MISWVRHCYLYSIVIFTFPTRFRFPYPHVNVTTDLPSTRKSAVIGDIHRSKTGGTMSVVINKWSK